MPAIDLARLKTQAARLSDKFGEPEAFAHDLEEMLDYYTNRTIRSTQVVQRLSLPTFHTPSPVLRQILSELEPLAETHPAEAVTLVRALWKMKTLESRLICARLLGCIPIPQASPLLSRLPDWLAQSPDKAVQEALLMEALNRLRRENPEELFNLLEDWLNSATGAKQVWGLQALIPILRDPHFENLPAMFRILRPAILSAGPITQLELQACLASLEKVSLTETLAFLRRTIQENPSSMMVRTLRRILPGLSPEMQAGLRELLRDGEKI